MKKYNAGLTLVELMVTLAVAIILFAVGIPLMDGFIAKNRSTTETNALVAALNLARSEAVKTSAPATVCAVADPDADDPTCDTGDPPDWTKGFFVFLDANGNKAIDPSEQPVRGWDALHADTSFIKVPAPVQFLATGEAEGAESDDLQFEIKNDETGQKRCISINAVGQIRTEKGECVDASETP